MLDASVARPRVLLVEDSSTLRSLMKAALVREDVAVDLATNGLEAVARVRLSMEEGRPFDLVLMDVVMPELSGIDATWQIRQTGYAGKVVILTASTREYDLASSLCAGADDYLPKPFTPEDLHRVLVAHHVVTDSAAAA